LDGFKRLVVHPCIANLKRLNLSYTKIDDETIILIRLAFFRLGI